MTQEHAYTAYHPRWFRRRMSTYWWLQRGSYLAFILRELSSLFVAWFVVYMLWLVRAVGAGAPGYREFLEWARHPAVLALNVVALLFIVFHAITWFNLAPQAMVVRVGRRPVPGFLIAASNYAAWLAVSAFLVWLLTGEPWESWQR
jgi:fumarate reductase subunit C